MSSDNSKSSGRIAVCTRFWTTKTEEDDEKVFEALDRWIERAVEYADNIIVAVRVEIDKANTIGHVERIAAARFGSDRTQLVALPVSPWGSFTPGGSFTPALNALLQTAATIRPRKPKYVDGTHVAEDDSSEFIMFQSLEVHINKGHFEKMMKFMDAETLVVGTALKDGHEFKEGENVLNGLTAPWNTNCIWHLKTLAKTGFLPISDGIAGGSGTAVEEVPVIALHQMIGLRFNTNSRTKCKLVKLEGVLWETGVENDEQLLTSHERKIRSKVERAEAQLELLGIPTGVVHHVSVSVPDSSSNVNPDDIFDPAANIFPD